MTVQRDNLPGFPREGFRLGAFEVRPGLSLLRGNGYETRLEPKAMDVLLALAEVAPQALSRAALLETAWKGQIVSEEVLTRCIHQLRRAFGDNPKNPAVIETIPKKGYRLLLTPEPVPPPSPPAAAGEDRNTVARPLRVVLIVAFVLLGAVWVFGRWDRTPASMPPSQASVAPEPFTTSIAVLPLRDLSSDGIGEFLASGLAEELIHQLTQIDGVRVIASNSAAIAKARIGTDTGLADRLDVGNLLEGTVQIEGGDVRVIVGLLDGRTGESIWSRRYDYPVDDLLALQRAITMDVTARLPGLLGLPERAPAMDIDAAVYADYLRALAAFASRESRAEGVGEAWDLIRQVVDQAPEYDKALGLAAKVSYALPAYRDGISEEDAFRQAEVYAKRALEIDPTNANARGALAGIAVRRGELGSGERLFRAAIADEPGNADLRREYAQLLGMTGRIRRALDQVQRAAALDPESAWVVQSLISRYVVADELAAAQATAETAIRMGRLSNSYVDMHLLVRLKRWRELELLIKQVWPTTGRDPFWAAPVVGFLAGTVDREAALGAVRTGVESGDIDTGTWFVIYAYMGEHDLAFERLEYLLADGPFGWWGQVWFPAMSGLRADPRFIELMDKYGLVDFWDEFGWPDRCARQGSRAQCW